MWTLADRIMKTVSDMTIGTVIVLVHVALAERASNRAGMRQLAAPRMPITPDATWRAYAKTARSSVSLPRG